MSRVLVTRPEPGGSATARLLRDMGHDPVVLPLTEIVPLAIHIDPAWAEAEAVVATSANAIRHVSDTLIARLKDQPLFVVGERTAAVARSRGFARVTSADGDAAALASLILDKARGARLLYLAGVDRRPELEGLLRDAGIALDVAEVYDTGKVSYSTDFLVQTFGGRRVDIGLVYSPRAGQLLGNVIRQPALSQLFDRTVFFTISRNVADAMSWSEDQQIHVAAKPTEHALLALLPPA